MPLTLVAGRPHPTLGRTEPLFELEKGQWTDSPHEHEDERFLVLIQSKQAGRTPPLAEVRMQVERDYTMRKRQELSEQLLRDLLDRYDVKIVAADPQSREQPDDCQ